MVGGRFKSKRTDLMRVFEVSRSSHLPTRILQVYNETVAGFSPAFSLDGLDNTLLPQGCVFGTAPSVGMVGKVYIPRTEEG